MNTNKLLPVLFLIVVAGCTSQQVSAPPHIDYRITYRDLNTNGVVDTEYHEAIGWADADWQLRDTDFDGRYDVKENYGFALTKEPIDMPVATNVTITK